MFACMCVYVCIQVCVHAPCISFCLCMSCVLNSTDLPPWWCLQEHKCGGIEKECQRKWKLQWRKRTDYSRQIAGRNGHCHAAERSRETIPLFKRNFGRRRRQSIDKSYHHLYLHSQVYRLLHFCSLQIGVGYISEMLHNLAITSERQEEYIETGLENYYAVDCVDRFCSCRLISAVDESFWMVKTLHKHSKKGVLRFLWPMQPDIDTMHNSCIFFGLVSLSVWIT